MQEKRNEWQKVKNDLKTDPCLEFNSGDIDKTDA